MMRSPKAMTIVCRKPSGEVVVRDDPWVSLASKWKFLRWPFLRGVLVFVEAMVNGVQALTFSANQALEEEEDGPLSPWAMAGTIAFAVGAGLALFVALPHLLTLWLGGLFQDDFGVKSLTFHIVDGVIKVAVFVGYIAAISLMKDVRRVFMYHGAEHMSIHAYEHDDPLTVECARVYPTLHPRCGTAFLLLVLIISIGLFAAIFPLLPKPNWPSWLANLFFIGIKMPLMAPIAGAAYEVTRYAGKHSDEAWLKPIIWPGLMLQKLTTRKPTDDQLEVALTALKRALARELGKPIEEEVGQEEISQEKAATEGCAPIGEGCA